MYKFFNILKYEIFYVLTFALFVFVSFELAWPRLVLAYININLILIIWLITGILILVDKR